MNRILYRRYLLAALSILGSML
ncbi:hypothetical protein LCGC14_2207420, partial [marine sediment metagenome]